MGIIGVVAALTLPNLNSSTGDREKVAKVKKIYQNLSDIHGRMEAVYGPYKEWNCGAYSSMHVCYAERMSDFLKVSKTCKNSNDCKDLGNSGDDIGYLLPDGVVITTTTSGIANQSAVIEDTVTINIDIGGIKGSHTNGKEKFKFIVTKEKGVMPSSDHRNHPSYLDDCVKGNGGTRFMCTGWVVNFGNMDYLKTKSDGTCKNNDKIKLDGVNNTTCK